MSDLAIRGYGKLTILEAERPFSVGTTVQGRILCEMRGIELAEYRGLMATLFDSNGAIQDQDLLRDWLLSSLKAGARRDKVAFEVEEDEWLFAVDELPATEWQRFFAVVAALNQTAPGDPPAGNAAGQPVNKTKTK
ncbi:hypothetical protein [Hymenobacter fodinae]|uniref:Uncharacterized protein n=1 Tax=Hymenobacter fodinae TaxID=2510796 RepID=A0A4Z0P5A0_9BACT|nr:hypothetical protein [Hymenobacter fodinae]TGE05556.1 hypothetical protein EU556_19850 [Hymenobacter fodinae]